MKIASFVLALVVFTSTHVFAQAETNTVTGSIREVKPHFAGEHTLVVNNEELVLITDLKDPSGNSFEINKEYKDLLIKKDDAFILNPKYEGKSLKFTYNINGKGWKCITKVSPITQTGTVKNRKIKAKKPNASSN
jgi:hypothetical protein